MNHLRACHEPSQSLSWTISELVTLTVFRSESKEFVQVLVGPDQEIRTLQKQSVWDRPYFRDSRQGLLYFDHNAEGMWQLIHPALADIQPDNFAFVAEYLESAAFGIRYPQEGEEMNEAFAQCASTWITAEKLGMSDLMDHIVEKLERIEPEMSAIFIFAVYVYSQTPSFSHLKLRDHLAVHIAENWWIYLDDDHLRSEVIKRLQTLPELERDIYQRRIPVLNDRVRASQEDSDTEMGD
jgi:hypothetical protein